ncbi:hypothetical protein E2562_031269 [Oryza meyeriana var. granulata]|uniref:Uncharacterized protein n=1 Tax=Oryza meyeriana var. granulata TaxID=110450 RepID=A0A6G1FEJ1_9ORYZ|nr:hypothetical protein E2562_031269 [Oryza meyeriana var. granulata]
MGAFCSTGVFFSPAPISSHRPSPRASTLSVTASYRVKLVSDSAKSRPPLQLRLTWAHSPLGPTLSFSPSASGRAVLVRRRRGSCSVPSGSGSGEDEVVEGESSSTPLLALFWDLTAARFDPAASLEPVSGYYVVAVAASAEVVLAVGDLAAEFVKAKFDGGEIPMALVSPFALGERVVVSSDAAAIMHTARAWFAEVGLEHEVSVGCSPGGADELWVSIDGKRAVQARRLRWNFRGNQTVFVDGAPVDVMWDLHGWWSGSRRAARGIIWSLYTGYAVAVRGVTWVPDILDGVYQCRCGMTCLWSRNEEALADAPDVITQSCASSVLLPAGTLLNTTTASQSTSFAPSICARAVHSILLSFR